MICNDNGTRKGHGGYSLPINRFLDAFRRMDGPPSPLSPVRSEW